MKKVIFVVVIAICSWSYAQESGCYGVCQKIMTLNPSFTPTEASSLALLFQKNAKNYQLDVNLLIAIAYQESRFINKTTRFETGLVFDEKSGQFRERKVGLDFCMMQISAFNIKKMKVNPKRLLERADYCLKTGAKILYSLKQQYSGYEKDWWTRYNAKTFLFRQEYKNRVARHLERLLSMK